jgi:hypothetical protein
MSLLDERSLAVTLDNVSAALFEGRRIPDRDKKKVARWIAGRQGLPGSYAGMFAPTPLDYEEGFRLFTGEPVRSGAGTGHILGEEACRALLVLAVPDREVEEALSRASRGILERLPVRGVSKGMYCCATCSLALWRHLAAGGLDDGPWRLGRGIRTLKEHRDGRGRWLRFPFYYTLLTLTEAGTHAATDELRYAAPALIRAYKRNTGEGLHKGRQRLLLERALAAARKERRA